MDDAKKTSAYADLMRLVNGYQISQAIHVAASLGVADHLHDTACSIEELASRTASHPGALYRLLRALASVGVLHEGENKTFSLTPKGKCLRSDAPMPVGDWAAHIGRPTSGSLGDTCCTACAPARSVSRICTSSRPGNFGPRIPRRMPSLTGR